MERFGSTSAFRSSRSPVAPARGAAAGAGLDRGPLRARVSGRRARRRRRISPSSRRWRRTRRRRAWPSLPRTTSRRGKTANDAERELRGGRLAAAARQDGDQLRLRHARPRRLYMSGWVPEFAEFLMPLARHAAAGSGRRSAAVVLLDRHLGRQPLRRRLHALAADALLQHGASGSRPGSTDRRRPGTS